MLNWLCSLKYRRLTETWPAQPRAPISIDLDAMAIEGVQFGTPLEECRQLGRPERIKVIDRTYISFRYPARGFLADFDRGELDCVRLVTLLDPRVLDTRGFEATRVTVTSPHQPDQTWTASTTGDAVRQCLGEPETIDDDDEERVLFHNWGDYRIETEFTLEDQLKCVNIFTRKA